MRRSRRRVSACLWAGVPVRLIFALSCLALRCSTHKDPMFIGHAAVFCTFSASCRQVSRCVGKQRPSDAGWSVRRTSVGLEESQRRGRVHPCCNQAAVSDGVDSDDFAHLDVWQGGGVGEPCTGPPGGEVAFEARHVGAAASRNVQKESNRVTGKERRASLSWDELFDDILPGTVHAISRDRTIPQRLGGVSDSSQRGRSPADAEVMNEESGRRGTARAGARDPVVHCEGGTGNDKVQDAQTGFGGTQRMGRRMRESEAGDTRRTLAEGRATRGGGVCVNAAKPTPMASTNAGPDGGANQKDSPSRSRPRMHDDRGILSRRRAGALRRCIKARLYSRYRASCRSCDQRFVARRARGRCSCGPQMRTRRR